MTLNIVVGGKRKLYLSFQPAVMDVLRARTFRLRQWFQSKLNKPVVEPLSFTKEYTESFTFQLEDIRPGMTRRAQRLAAIEILRGCGVDASMYTPKFWERC